MIDEVTIEIKRTRITTKVFEKGRLFGKVDTTIDIYGVLTPRANWQEVLETHFGSEEVKQDCNDLIKALENRGPDEILRALYRLDLMYGGE